MPKFSAYKRRTIQSWRESFGLGGEVTVDPHFQQSYSEFHGLVAEMMEIGANVHVQLEQAKLYTATSAQLSENLSGYFAGTAFGASTTQKLSSASEHVSSVVRKSVAVVVLEQCLNPLKEFCSARVPEIESRVQQRNNLRKDHDAYRRRLKDLQATSEPDRQKLDLLRQKLESAKNQYDQLNAALLDEFAQLKASKETLLVNQATALVVCQHELFSRSAEALAGTLERLPAATKRKTEKSIEQLVRSGGPDPSVTAASILSNRASFQIKPVEAAMLVAAAPPAARITSSRNTSARRSGAKKRSRPPPGPPPTAPVPAHPPLLAQRTLAIALHPFKARDGTEVSFKAGDTVEIVEQDESGWWIGLVDGKTGQFPSNYVEVKKQRPQQHEQKPSLGRS